MSQDIEFTKVTAKMGWRWRLMTYRLKFRIAFDRAWATRSWNPRTWRRAYLSVLAVEKAIQQDMSNALLFGPPGD